MKNTAETFKLSPRGALLALVSAALSAPALANTGRVDFTIGSVNVTDPAGRVQPLQKGAELRSGYRVTCGVDGRAQIRFSDGAYVSLQPNTDFDIREYRYNGRTDGTESALFGLFKGALRTVTGLVGRVNRDKYQITTPTATIGIRGTGGLIQVGADGSTLVTGTSGIWSLSNNGGTLNIPAGTAGFAGNNRNLAPQPSVQGPVVPPPQQPPVKLVDTIDYVQGNNVTAGGGPAGLVLVSGPGYAIVDAKSLGTGGVSSASSSNAVFDANGALVQFDFVGAAPTVVTLVSGVQNEFGTNGILAWSRWTGDVMTTVGGTVPTASTQTFGPNQGLHTVAGIPTASAAMPTGVIFTYNMIGATSPTGANGAFAPGTLNAASLVGNFMTGSVQVNLDATVGGLSFIGSATGSVSNVFTASGSTVVGSGCSGCGCGISVNGFFAGAGATHAGITYNFTGNTSTGDVSGAAALAR